MLFYCLYSLYTDNFNPFPQVIHTTNTSSFKTIGDVIFGIWPMLVLLCILFALGIRRQNGLWSIDHLSKSPRDGSWDSGYESPDTDRVQPWQREGSRQGSNYSSQHSYMLRESNSSYPISSIQDNFSRLVRWSNHKSRRSCLHQSPGCVYSAIHQRQRTIPMIRFRLQVHRLHRMLIIWG